MGTWVHGHKHVSEMRGSTLSQSGEGRGGRAPSVSVGLSLPQPRWGKLSMETRSCSLSSGEGPELSPVQFLLRKKLGQKAEVSQAQLGAVVEQGEQILVLLASQPVHQLLLVP